MPRSDRRAVEEPLRPGVPDGHHAVVARVAVRRRVTRNVRGQRRLFFAAANASNRDVIRPCATRGVARAPQASPSWRIRSTIARAKTSASSAGRAGREQRLSQRRLRQPPRVPVEPGDVLDRDAARDLRRALALIPEVDEPVTHAGDEVRRLLLEAGRIPPIARDDVRAPAAHGAAPVGDQIARFAAPPRRTLRRWRYSIRAPRRGGPSCPSWTAACSGSSGRSTARLPTNGLSFHAQLCSLNSIRTLRSSSSNRASAKRPSSAMHCRARARSCRPDDRPGRDVVRDLGEVAARGGHAHGECLRPGLVLPTSRATGGRGRRARRCTAASR